MQADLNLPKIPDQYLNGEDPPMIWDIVRKKELLMTPEENVRQAFIHFLKNERGFPTSLMRLESSLNYNEKQKRSDLFVLRPNGEVTLLVEFKSYKKKISQSAVEQLAAYNKVISAHYLALSNGLNHYFFRRNSDKNGTVSYKQLSELKMYPELIKD